MSEEAEMATKEKMAENPGGFVTDPEVFEKRWNEMRSAIAERAYHLFEEREAREDGDMTMDWFQAESEILEKVPIEVRQSEDAFQIDAMIPDGFTMDDIQLAVDRDRVTIQGHTSERTEQSSEENGEIIYSEMDSRQIRREVNLPEPVVPEKVEFKMEGGQLHVKLPRGG